MSFDKCVHYHHHKQDTEHLHHPKKFPSAPLQSFPLPQPLVTTGHSVLIVLPVSDSHKCNHTDCI